MNLMNIEQPPINLSFTSGVSNRVALPTNTSQSFYIMITNRGTADVMVKVGDANVTASITDTLILARGVYSFKINPNITHIAATTDSGAGTIQMLVGDGA